MCSSVLQRFNKDLQYNRVNKIDRRLQIAYTRNTVDEILVSMTVSSAVTVILVTLASVWLLLTWILRSLRPRDKPGQTRLCCVLGSGGHTTEMVRLVTSLPPGTFSPRTYVMAETDRFSEAKVEELEMERPGQHVIVRVPRAREVRYAHVSLSG